MCGDIPKGHYAKDVVAFLQTNQTFIRVPLPHDFENVVEIRCREGFVVGAGAVGAWRIKVDTQMPEDEATNAIGQGFVFGINNTTCTHVVYTNPRVVTKAHRTKMTDLVVYISGVSAANAATVPTYTQAFFIFTFVMKNARFEPGLALLQDATLPQNARGPFSTKAPYQPPLQTF